MKFSIAQIGENRLKKVLVEDKQNSPEKLCEVIKSDVYNIVKCYVDNPKINVEAKQIDEEIVFEISVNCDRVKSFGVLA